MSIIILKLILKQNKLKNYYKDNYKLKIYVNYKLVK